MTPIFKQQKTFSVFAQPDIDTRGVGRILDSSANLLNLSCGHLASLGNCLEIKAISRSRVKKLYRLLLFSSLHLLELVCSCATIKEYVLHALVQALIDCACKRSILCYQQCQIFFQIILNLCQFFFLIMFLLFK